jgi:hypothetical protein
LRRRNDVLYLLLLLSVLMPLVLLEPLLLLVLLVAGLDFDDLVLVVLVFDLCVDFDAGFVASLVVASVVAGALAAGVAVGAAAGAIAGAGVWAAAVSDTAKAPASSADINLVIFQSSGEVGYKMTQIRVSGALTPLAPSG